MKKSLICLFFALSCLFAFLSPAIIALSTPVEPIDVEIKINTIDNKTEFCQGDEVLLKVTAKPSHTINITDIKMKVNYDTENLKFKSIYNPNGISNSLRYETQKSLNCLEIKPSLVFKPIFLEKDVETEIFTINFGIKQTAECGDQIFEFSFDYLNHERGIVCLNSVNPVDIVINRRIVPPCDLAELTADHGTLSPAFSPDVYEYVLTVPEKIDWIEIKARAIEEDSVVKLNRRALYITEKPADMIITVTNKKQKSRSAYLVTAVREKKTPKPFNPKSYYESPYGFGNGVSPRFSAFTLSVKQKEPKAKTQKPKKTKSSAGKTTAKNKPKKKSKKLEKIDKLNNNDFEKDNENAQDLTKTLEVNNSNLDNNKTKTVIKNENESHLSTYIIISGILFLDAAAAIIVILKLKENKLAKANNSRA